VLDVCVEKFMPAKEYTTVNLLSKDPFSESFIGRVLMWALSIGRYIVVFTELVVILSFLSRFTLDRQMTDLNSKINQQLLIVESYGDLEVNFRSLQDKLAFVRSQTEKTNLEDVLDIIVSRLPPDVKLVKLSVQNETVSISATTLSSGGMSRFINGLRSDKGFTDIKLSSVTTDSLNEDSVSFDVSLTIREGGGKRI
jgi:hypothetical protein